jgi:hypothetical protein
MFVSFLSSNHIINLDATTTTETINSLRSCFIVKGELVMSLQCISKHLDCYSWMLMLFNHAKQVRNIRLEFQVFLQIQTPYIIILS